VQMIYAMCFFFVFVFGASGSKVFCFSFVGERFFAFSKLLEEANAWTQHNKVMI